MKTYAAHLRWVLLALVLGFAACTLPQWRVGQKKIDPTLAQKPPEQTESERQAAQFIVARSAPRMQQMPTVDELLQSLRQQLADVHAVAVPLAASLGEPRQPVKLEDQTRVIEQLRRGMLAEQRKTEQWRAFALKYAHQPLEDTGINLTGPAGLLGLLAVIAACVLCPGFLYLLMRVVPVLWGALRSAAGGIEALAEKAPAAVEEVKKTMLATRMTTANRTAVRMAKQGIVRGVLTKATA